MFASKILHNAVIVCFCVFSGSSVSMAQGLDIGERTLDQRRTMEKIERLAQASQMLREAGEADAAVKIEARIRELQQQIQKQSLTHRENTSQPAIMNSLLEIKKRQHMLMEQLEETRHEVAELHRSLHELRAFLEERHASEHAEEMSKVDLSGEWLMKLPGGSESVVELINQEDGLVRFKSKTVLSGVYEHDGKDLKVVIPKDKRLTEFRWEIRHPHYLLLIESSTKTGADYSGATLSRVIPHPDA